MNQLTTLSPETSLEKLYENKKQPNLQIAIMKAIALNGAMTKPKLAKMLDTKNTSIATTITADSKNKELRCIHYVHNEFEVIKNIQQPLFQLTDFGMSMLLVSHYKKTDKESTGQPFLNYKEFLKLISIFKQKHSNNFLDFKKDRILVVVFYYLSANPNTCDKLIIKHKNNSKIHELETDIKSDELKIKKLNREKSKKQNMIIGLLSETLISSLKK